MLRKTANLGILDYLKNSAIFLKKYKFSLNYH